jgi:hypothetical protein
MNNWKWRDNEITLKEFYNLPQQDKDEYVLMIEGLKPEQRSSMDEILLNRFSKNKRDVNKFLEL